MDARRLGQWLTKYKGRVIEDTNESTKPELRFVQTGKTREGAVTWMVELLGASESAETHSLAETKNEIYASQKKSLEENISETKKADFDSARLCVSAPLPDTPQPPQKVKVVREVPLTVADALREGATLREYALLMGYDSEDDEELVSWATCGLMARPAHFFFWR